jgi:pimeloyl-ACP methyl ester carboxylesterase
MRRGDEQDWTFGGLWPYEPRWFQTSDGLIHYVDEGPRDGRPVVLVHGAPTWGFLYRNFIGPLVSAGYRVIVPDHLGCGRSDKPADRDAYLIERHIRRLDALLESLDLHDATIAVQDWGGPIGLSWAVAHPERIAGLLIMNTNAHRPPAVVKLPLPIRLFRMPVVGELLVKGLGVFQRMFLFRAGVAKPERLTPAVKRAYLAPHPTWTSRTGILQFPRQIPSGPTGPVADLDGYLEEALEQFRDRPVAIAWGMQDPAFKPFFIDRFVKTFPDARVARIDDASHFLQEDAHERVVPVLLDLLGAQQPEAVR